MAKKRLFAAVEGRITIVAPAGGFTVDVPKLVGSMLVIPGSTVAAGVVTTVFINGVWTMPKTTGIAWTAGMKLYWDNAAAKVTNVSAGNTYIGIALQIQASGDTEGAVIMVGPVVP